ncbi:MAG: binding-protein-dependent transport system inner rane component [Aeromicrobium sp.]|nr:binding-protein-dependent transport system inner rane component [Aeromicrobium sp.]
MTTVTEQPNARTSSSSGGPGDRPTVSGGSGRGSGGGAAWLRRAPLLPALLFTIVMTQLPFLATLVISFMHYQAYAPDSHGFAGFSNFKAVFQSADLRSSALTTVYLTVTVVLVSLVLGMGIALLLNRSFFGRGIVRTMIITPFLVVPVAAALFFKHGIFNPSSGLINGVISWVWGLFGDTTPPAPDWLSQFPLLSVELQLIWQWTPFMTLILLAGLQSRSHDVLEAAAVDGAGPWRTFASITLPHMRQYLELAGLLGSIYVVQNFDSVFTITSGSLGTANLPYTVYTTVFNAQDYGLASAQGVIVVIASIGIATLALRTVFSLFQPEGAR